MASRGCSVPWPSTHLSRRIRCWNMPRRPSCVKTVGAAGNGARTTSRPA